MSRRGRPVSQLQLCDMCAEVVFSGGMELPDGRVVCPTCHETGLYEEHEIEAVRQKVLETFSEFGMTLRKPAPLKVVDARQMSQETGLPWMPSVHHDARPLGGYGVAAQRELLLVESGQPPAILTWTLAHESAHDWHAENNAAFNLLEDEIREGFAQWAADEVAHRLGYAEVARRQLDRRDIYGLAPKPFFHLEAVGGIPEVLAFASRVGTARLMRMQHQFMRGGQQAILLELQKEYGGWPKARDLTADAEYLQRRGNVFAASLCLRMAAQAMPLNPLLRWKAWQRRLKNMVLLLSFARGRALPAIGLWLLIVPMVLLAGWLLVR